MGVCIGMVTAVPEAETRMDQDQEVTSEGGASSSVPPVLPPPEVTPLLPAPPGGLVRVSPLSMPEATTFDMGGGATVSAPLEGGGVSLSVIPPRPHSGYLPS